MVTKRPSTSERQRLIVKNRAGDRCEAEVEVSGVWARCFASPIEVHHMLTRARGGDLLDQAGETYHLVALCPTHHREAVGSSGYEGGLLLEGYVTLDAATGEIIYDGPDPFLRQMYGKVHA